MKINTTYLILRKYCLTTKILTPIVSGDRNFAVAGQLLGSPPTGGAIEVQSYVDQVAVKGWGPWWSDPPVAGYVTSDRGRNLSLCESLRDTG